MTNLVGVVQHSRPSPTGHGEGEGVPKSRATVRQTLFVPCRGTFPKLSKHKEAHTHTRHRRARASTQCASSPMRLYQSSKVFSTLLAAQCDLFWGVVAPPSVRCFYRGRCLPSGAAGPSAAQRWRCKRQGDGRLHRGAVVFGFS